MIHYFLDSDDFRGWDLSTRGFKAETLVVLDNPLSEVDRVHLNGRVGRYLRDSRVVITNEELQKPPSLISLPSVRDIGVPNLYLINRGSIGLVPINAINENFEHGDLIN